MSRNIIHIMFGVDLVDHRVEMQIQEKKGGEWVTKSFNVPEAINHLLD